MARVTSQKTRQAILTTDSPWNPNLIPEKLALFDLNGVPISLTGAGIPVGGTIGQVLGKVGIEDFNTNWVDPAQGGGGGGGGLVPWEEDTTYEFGDQVVYEGNIYEANAETTGYIPGTDPPPGGPPLFLDTYVARTLTETYQDAEVLASKPVIPGAHKGGPVDLWAYKVGTLGPTGIIGVRTTHRAGYDAYMTLCRENGTVIMSDDDGAGNAHPYCQVGVGTITEGEIIYALFHAYDGAGSPAKLSSIKVDLINGATLGAFPSGEVAPWDFVGIAEVSVPEGGTAGQVLGKVSDEDYDIAWVEGGGGGGGEPESTQLTIYHDSEQVFTVTSPAVATLEDKLIFSLEEAGVVKVLAQLNAWANNDLVVYLYVDGAPAIGENGANISKSCGAGSPIIQYLGFSNGLSGFVQGTGGQTAPRVIGGDGIELYLPAGDHTVEMRYHSSTGANARISHRRLTVILPAFNGGGGGGGGGGSDATAMHFKGNWSDSVEYDLGDVVLDYGLYILKVEELGAGQTAPHLEEGLSPTAPNPGGDIVSPPTTCDRIDPVTGDASNNIGRALFFFDLATGGTVTITDDAHSGDYLILCNASGATVQSNFPSGAFGSPLVATGLAAGRYFLDNQDAFASPPWNAHPLVELSAGATFDFGNQKWTKLADIVT